MSLNIRLSEEEARMAARLRAKGVQISGLVRQAIRAEYERRIARPNQESAASVARRILEELPDPPDLSPRKVSPNDRRAVQHHIKRQLLKRRG